MNERYFRLLGGLMCILLLLAGCGRTAAVMAEPSSGIWRESVLASDDTGGTGDRGGTAADPAVTDTTPVICVDPGHGFGDNGTYSDLLGELYEKDVTLAIGLMLRDELEARGFRVLLTHDGETFPKAENDDGNDLFRPQERIAYVKTKKIDYYVSIHCDSYEDIASVNGTRIYYSADTKHTKQSAKVAEAICKAINAAQPDAKKTTVTEMKYDQAYYVIREAPVPAALIEVGFVTNPMDAKNMTDPAWQALIAAAIAEGIGAYFTD